MSYAYKQRRGVVFVGLWKSLFCGNRSCRKKTIVSFFAGNTHSFHSNGRMQFSLPELPELDHIANGSKTGTTSVRPRCPVRHRGITAIPDVPQASGRGSSAKQCTFYCFYLYRTYRFYEYMYDTAVLAHSKGLKTVMISNGYINPTPLADLIPYLMQPTLT